MGCGIFRSPRMRKSAGQLLIPRPRAATMRTFTSNDNSNGNDNRTIDNNDDDNNGED
jgi:hypothetical protein